MKKETNIYLELLETNDLLVELIQLVKKIDNKILMFDLFSTILKIIKSLDKIRLDLSNEKN